MASDSFQFDHTNLQWQTWTGSIPNGAVSIYNEKCKRTEYVAKSGLESGFYCPSLDQCCHYSYYNKEHKVTSFELLVNKDNFELLEWKPGSYGSVPENAVKTIPGSDTYVARGQYGLGKVHASNKAFFYPWKGKEYWSKKYDVLTFSRDVTKEDIFDVKYKIDVVKTIQHPPEIIAKTTVENRDSHEATQTTQLTETITESNSWSVNTNRTFGAKATITAGVPLFTSANIEMSMEVSRSYNKGFTQTKSKSKSVSIEHQIPPRHSCTVTMEARMFSADIPFTAQVRRTFRNGKTTRTTITGTYKGVQVAEVRGVVEPCVPL